MCSPNLVDDAGELACETCPSDVGLLLDALFSWAGSRVGELYDEGLRSLDAEALSAATKVFWGVSRAYDSAFLELSLDRDWHVHEAVAKPDKGNLTPSTHPQWLGEVNRDVPLEPARA